MNAAHLHLIINHIPVVGSVGVALILLYGFVKKNEEIKKLALLLLILISSITFLVSRSGHQAEDIAEKFPGVTESLIEAHEEAGEKAFIAIEIAGGLALLSLLAGLKSKSIASGLTFLVLLSSLASAGLMAWTAKLGGVIRHPEARSDFQASSTLSETNKNQDDD